jgi:zinc transport system substrate-binding protein
MRAPARRRALPALAAALVIALAGSGGHAAEPPRVVATINPVHSLVAGVMAGVGKPYLLIRGGASPHTYVLRPSDARALDRAKVIFWVGEELETFLTRPLKALGGKAKIVALAEAKGVTLLKLREGGVWEPHAHEEHGHEEHGHAAYNPHIWLDPVNAKAMVDAIAAALSEADPANAGAYHVNAATLRARLDRLDAALAARLAPVRTRPFIVFHDAYPYFERRYGLNGAGSITLSPERQPGARRLAAIRARIRARHIRCVFAEPQFRPHLVRTVTEGTGAKGAVLDPLGAAVPTGPEAYFTIMDRLAKDLADCLAGNS